MHLTSVGGARARCASDSERTKPAAALPPAAGADDVVLTGGQPATESSCLLAPDATPKTKNRWRVYIACYRARLLPEHRFVPEPSHANTLYILRLTPRRTQPAPARDPRWQRRQRLTRTFGRIPQIPARAQGHAPPHHALGHDLHS